MPRLTSRERANLPDRAFAYIDSHGKRRLPINDEAHVRNALARFERVAFEDEAARERARKRLLNAAKRYGIVPVGFITGQIQSERRSHSPDFSTFPRGAVTFLMTDIEGSTGLLRQLEDRYAGVLRDVRGVIRSAVRHWGGRQVDAHGDEFLGVFENGAAAVEAAVACRRTLAVRSWPDGVVVRIRAGIHSGRPTLTETGYVGLAVHAVARICSAADGGQIVMSGQTKTAIKGGMPPGVRLRSLGRRRLAGLPKAEALFEVLAE